MNRWTYWFFVQEVVDERNCQMLNTGAAHNAALSFTAPPAEASVISASQPSGVAGDAHSGSDSNSSSFSSSGSDDDADSASDSP